MSDSPVCRICGRPATHYGVRTGRSWVDHIPILAWVSRLQGLALRYTIVDDWAPEPKYCRTCHDQAESKLAAAHAAIRAAHAEFNARQERELAAIDHGGLDQQLAAEFADTLRRLQLTVATEQPKQLDAAPQTTHVMSVATTGGE